MDQPEASFLEESFENYRAYLFGIAYRMLGSAMDAEDMVQETFLRYQTANPGDLDSLKAYLTTILTRLCIDQLGTARRKREVYVGPWLPEPILTTPNVGIEAGNPEKRVEMEESISLAFLVLLEQLQPFERAVFLLREVFDYKFTEIAEMLGKSEAACRKSFSRARPHLRENRPRFSASRQTQQQLLQSYVKAVETGEISELMNLLSEDVVLWTDAGGKTVTAAYRPIHGQDPVARFSLGTKRFWPSNYHTRLSEVNGQPAMLLLSGDKIFAVLTVDTTSERIQTIRVMANPEKLVGL